LVDLSPNDRRFVRCLRSRGAHDSTQIDGKRVAVRWRADQRNELEQLCPPHYTVNRRQRTAQVLSRRVSQHRKHRQPKKNIDLIVQRYKEAREIARNE
jgi:hypothetical protein